MIVTIVCDVLGEENNGTTIAAFNLIRSLRARGHTVRVVCPDEMYAGQLDFFIMPTYNFGEFLNNYVHKNGVELAKLDRDMLAAAIDGADVVHAMLPFALGAAAAKMARERGIPLTAGFHCQAENITNHIFLMNVGLANQLTYKILYKRLYQYCDAIHYPTQFICDVFEQEVGPTNHYVISNGVGREFTPAPAPREPDGTFRILFTGRLSREKSHRVLIDAAARSRHSDEIRLFFAGDGPLKGELSEYSQKVLSHPPVVGFYSRAELVELIRSCDLYVHPAEIEIEAIACLEAIACGLVPVISDSPRSATNHFALTARNRFRCNDADDLAAQIDYWIEHPQERAQCREQYLGYAEQFAFDRCMERMEGMLRDVVQRKRT